MTILNQIDKWIEENKNDFVPPVCNKCMYANQLKVFFVGGPNQRKDYHLEEGEEVFYQRKGDMVLKVLEKGIRRDVVIKEGEIFMLPSRVEHSPQRFENTIGFVVERTRKNTEFECVRYFVGESTERLYERWLHLDDVVKDLPPVIREFFASDECNSGRPGSASFIVNAPYEPRCIELEAPINLNAFLKEHAQEIRKSPLQLYGAPKYKTSVVIHGEGSHTVHCDTMNELLLWIKEGTVQLKCSDFEKVVEGNAMLRIDPGQSCDFTISSGVLISISMPTF